MTTKSAVRAPTLHKPRATAKRRSVPVEISVVMPCLNEEDSVGRCVHQAQEGIAATGLTGEVVVVDNGSTDRSADAAAAAGARVVSEPVRGYGRAYLRGFAAARGRLIVMGDSDGTYDFSRLDRLVAALGEGNDYVLGSRFTGTIERGAMPWSHRYLGNPVLTRLLNRFFGLSTSDAHSGMRAFTREAYERMELRCEGMEFASEIVIKAARAGLRIAEVPISYRPRVGESKLSALRDGWRHLRFLLLLSPRYLFILPGLALFALGMIGQSILLAGSLRVGGHDLDVHFSALFALMALLGSQALLCGAVGRWWSASVGLEPHGALSRWMEDGFSLERGLVASGMVFAFGLLVDVWVLADWIGRSLGPINLMRQALFALTMMVLGAQGAFASFLFALFRMRIHASGTPPVG